MSLASTVHQLLFILILIFSLPQSKLIVEGKDGTTYPPSMLVDWSPPHKTETEIYSDGPGEMGAAAEIPAYLKDKAKDTFSINQFNLVASDLMSLDRSLPDVRPDQCLLVEHPHQLPTTSVIIIFHNEAWSTLIRSVHSVINRSPLHLVKEILLVDDASDPNHSHLGTRLEEYVSRLPVQVRVLRTGVRSGLIRARLLGAGKATAPVLTFLDSHVECTEGWLVPLLAQVTDNRHNVVSPVIDVISDETFEYTPVTEVSVGGFDWGLNFNWFMRPGQGRDKSIALETPTMAGGLFSVDREYFYRVGAYDEGMDVWGAENLEMSFRVWMCGGRLLIHPCSHVGHVFRKASPYTFPGGTEKVLTKNKLRLAEVWMDEWKKFYTSSSPNIITSSPGDLTLRKQLRSDLKCNSFRWYLKNVYPETSIPLDFIHLGHVANVLTGLCLDTMARKATEEVGVSACHGQGGNQVWAYTAQHQVRTGELCLDASGMEGPVKLWNCHGLGGNQAWVVSQELQTIRHVVTERCLVVEGESLGLAECGVGNEQLRWQLVGLEEY